MPDDGYRIIELFDLYGKKVMVLVQGEKQQGKDEFSTEISKLPAGLYFVRLQTPDQVFTKKLIIN
jgi:hypothetical protein